MKENENKKNIWRCVLVGVFAVSLFAAFTTEGLAINPQPLPPSDFKRHTMAFADGSMFNAINPQPLPPSELKRHTMTLVDGSMFNALNMAMWSGL